MDKQLEELVEAKRINLSRANTNLIPRALREKLKKEGYQLKGSLMLPYYGADIFLEYIASSSRENKGLIILKGDGFVEGSFEGAYSSIDGKCLLVKPYPDRGGFMVQSYRSRNSMSLDFSADKVTSRSMLDETEPHIMLYAHMKGPGIRVKLKFHTTNVNFIYVPAKTHS